MSLCQSTRTRVQGCPQGPGWDEGTDAAQWIFRSYEAVGLAQPGFRPGRGTETARLAAMGMHCCQWREGRLVSSCTSALSALG